MEFKAVQQFMGEQKIDGWLVYDFRGNNTILARLLPGKRWTTRRAVLWVPAAGQPTLLAHGIDEHQFDGVSVAREKYLSWNDLHAWLQSKLAGMQRVAMEYAPGATLPVVSIVDAGTVELVRAFGVEVVSSANLIQVCVACFSPEALEAHKITSARVGRIKDDAFKLIRERLAAGQGVTEHDIQQHIVAAFAAGGLEATEPPIVAANAHSGDPHYEPSATSPTPIRRGDWVLIDLWARTPGEQNIYSDITWVGFAGKDVPARHKEVFQVVRAARDRSLERAVQAWKKGERIQGWQLDDAARGVIIDAGYEKYIRHRTGHSLSPGPMVHGIGMNLDNLETHDTREMLPGLGFTIEPGIYLPEFGVRLEINVYVAPKTGPIVTSVLQDEIVLIA
ncbi:MAG: Xaa-Pro peptidase family protein [Planctomycetota bacterium]